MATRKVDQLKTLENKLSKWRDEGRKLLNEVEDYLESGVKRCPHCDEIVEEGDTSGIENLQEIQGELDAFIDTISSYI